MALSTVDASPPADPVVALIQEGRHREALAACVHHHGESLGRFCMALLGDQAEAEEVTQETLIAAHDGFASFRGEGALRSWLFGIARRQCARRMAKRTRREQKLQLAFDASRDAETPADVLVRRQRAAGVRQVLEELKPSEREALLLRYEAQLSYREIAEVTGQNDVTVRKRTSRALARFRSLYSRAFSTGDDR